MNSNDEMNRDLEVIEDSLVSYSDSEVSTNKQMNPKIQILTDDIIAQYSEDNILTEYRDIDLHVTTKVAPYPKGVYDQDIFGSLFSDRCNCGTVRTTGLRCPRCGSIILDENQSFKRFARIESPVYFSTKYKFNQLRDFLKNNWNIIQDIQSAHFDVFSRNDRLIAIYDICQWSWDEEKEALVISDDITDFTKCSYEGLIKIISDKFPDKLPELRAYVNQFILVVPLAIRAPQLRLVDGQKRLDNHYTSTVYRNIIYAIEEYYKNTFPTMKTESGKAIFRGSLRKLITSSLDQLSQLMRSSKDNLARYMQKTRLPNSGRCVIVPDPALNADEVMIPRHLMYETCRDEFIQYIADKKGIGLKEAEIIYKTQATLDEIQKLFDEYIDGDGTPNSGKYVIINRQPSLHEYGMFSCKVRLTNDYTLKLPMVLCDGFNADFDGDQMAYFVVPNDKNELVNNALSARNRFYYRKNQSVIYRPKGDMMHGLTLATKLDPQSKPQLFDSLDEAKEYQKTHPEFKTQTECIINGSRTSIGRETLSELFGKDVNAYIRDLNAKSLTPKNMIYLYTQLSDLDDRLERIQKIQEYALKIVTMSGATSTKISELYLDIDESYLKRIKEIEEKDDIDPKTKELAIREIYQEFTKAQLEKIPEGIKMIIDESGGKSSGLVEMSVQRLHVSPYKDYHITETTLAEGLSQEDYEWHAIENRGTLTIKSGAVPQSGYLTRQFIYLASEYTYVDKTDDENEGIFVEERYAKGRTTVDGKLIENPDKNSTKLIKVRSIITSKQEKNIITKDMISPITKYNEGSRIGMSLITSVTEQLTQGGLALKHGGNLFGLDFDEDTGYGCFIAQEDGKVELTPDWVLFNGNSGKVYKYPKGEKFTLKYSPDDTFKKGQVFGVDYNSVTPAYKVDSIIKLCGARPSPMKKSFANNKKEFSCCYAAEDGIIHYNLVDGWIYVDINGDDYWYEPSCSYYLPDGASVKKGDRICTGTLNLAAMSEKIPDYIELYYIFRKQFKELMHDGIVDELIEFLYVLIAKQTEYGTIVQSVTKNIYESESFYKTLAFADNAKSFNKIGYEGIDFVSDPITAVMLSLINNDNVI